MRKAWPVWCGLAVLLVVSAVEAASFEHTGYVYPTFRLPFEYRLNPTAIAPGVPDSLNVYRQAFDRWNGLENFPFQFIEGPPTDAAKAADAVNTVALAERFLGTALAINTLYLDRVDYLLENDIEINPDRTFAIDGRAGAYDLLSVMMHEAGHCLSLDDLYTDADRGRTMFGVIRVGETQAATLAAGDIAEAREFYPEGPPMPPRVSDAFYDGEAVRILWHRSPSYNQRRTIIERQEGDGPWTEFERYGRFDPELRDNLLVDDTVRPGERYAYRFTTWDEDDNAGPSTAPVVVRAALRPQVMMAGMWDSRVSEAEGGTLRLVAWLDHPAGKAMKGLVLLQGLETGIELWDDGGAGDDVAGDGLYSAVVELPAGVPAQELLLEIVPIDEDGVRGLAWPRFAAESVYGAGLVEPAGWQVLQERALTRRDAVPELAVWAGGYLGERFVVERDVRFSMWAFVPVPGAIVEVYVNGLNTGVRLFDTGFYDDFDAGDGVYAIQIPTGRTHLVPAGAYTLELRARDGEGRVGPLYPYFSVLP